MGKLEKFDVAVIGGGPAGISAAIQLKRYGLEPVLIEKSVLGGALLNANLVENYLGFPSGIRGPDLAKRIRKQLKASRVKVVHSKVKAIVRGPRDFDVKIDGGNIDAKSVVVAVGLAPKKLGLPGEEALHAEGRLFYEMWETPRVRHSSFAIIGGGDAAFDCALNLSGRGNRVCILCRSRPHCLRVLENRARRNEKILVLPNTTVQGVERKKGKVILTCNLKRKIECDYVIVAVGKGSNNPLIGSKLKGPKAESLGFFEAGDAQRGRYRQLGIAVGDGLLAAMKAKEYLEGSDGNP